MAYKLDTAGNRLQVLEDGVVTKRYVYAPESTSPVAEVDASGNTTTRYAYAPGSNVPAYMTRSGVTYRFITDQLGSVRRVVNTSTGAVAQSIDYDPYGKITEDSNENFQPFGFASGLYDSHTGLTHFGAREYDPGLGRWTSSDPIGFDGGDPNLYGYVLGDPVNWVDPGGTSISGDAFGGLGDKVNGGFQAVVDTPVARTIGEIPNTIMNGDAGRFAWEYGDDYAIGAAIAVCIAGTMGVGTGSCLAALAAANRADAAHDFVDLLRGHICLSDWIVDQLINALPGGALRELRGPS